NQTLALHLAKGYGSALDRYLDFGDLEANGGNGATSFLYTFGEPMNASASYDAAAFLPLLQGLALDPTNDPARPVLSSPVDGALPPSAEAAMAYFSWGLESYGMWEIFAPAGHTSITVPELPDELAAYRPPQASAVSSGVACFDLDSIDDYAKVRA